MSRTFGKPEIHFNKLLTYAINQTIIIFAGIRNTCRTGRETYGKTEKMQKSLPHAEDL